MKTANILLEQTPFLQKQSLVKNASPVYPQKTLQTRVPEDTLHEQRLAVLINLWPYNGTD